MLNAPQDPLQWLKTQQIYPKVYLEFGDEIFIAIGEVERCDEIPDREERFFGGMNFQPRKGQSPFWDSYPHSFFFLPAVEIHYQSGQSDVTKRLSFKEKAAQEEAPRPIPTPIAREELFPKELYTETIDTLTDEMRRGYYEKAVIARCTRFDFKEPLCPFQWLSRLPQNNACRFLFQLSEESAFVGATPEALYHKDRGTIKTHAVAGTRRNIESLDQELLSNQKEIEEFNYVFDDIQSKLAEHCHAVESGPIALLKTKTVQHLTRTFTGTLLESISDKALITSLHPTPATGGTPREKALEIIAQNEPFDRGWYAAPIGFVSRERSALFVAIRSAVVEEKNLYLFAGSGIVQGSIAESEREELKNKMSQFYLWENV